MNTKQRITIVLVLLTSLVISGCGSSQVPKLQSGATFSGDLTQDSPGDNTSAGGGRIEFTISDDGESIASLSYSLFGDTCWNESRTTTRTGVGYTTTQNPPPPINNEGFVWKDNYIAVKAVFISSTEASGTMAISIKDMSSQLTCHYGTWDWNANVK
jgi:hypothetical protein